MNDFSFKKGWSQVLNKDTIQVRSEIIRALKLKNHRSFYPRLRGEVEPKVSEAKAIEEIFAKRGIKDIWGKS